MQKCVELVMVEGKSADKAALFYFKDSISGQK